MAEPLKLSSKKYLKEIKVSIDDKVWSIKLPGANTELAMSQAMRNGKRIQARLEILNKKIDAGTITEEELDKYDQASKEYEQAENLVSAVFESIFRDSTSDNSEVRQWLKETPLPVVSQIFEDIKEISENKSRDEAVDGQTESQTAQA